MTEGGGLTARVFSGVSWLAVARGINRGFIFLTTLILARLLSPSEFGLVAAAMVVTNFLCIFNEFGIGPAIVQSKDLDEGDLSSVFWPNLLMGVLLFAIALLFASPTAKFFSNEAIGPIFMVLSFTMVIKSFGIVQSSILTRRLEFKSLAVRDVISSVGYGVSAIVGPFLGWGVWALVAGYLVKSLVGAATLWFSVSWRPKLSFDFSVFKRIYAFGIKIVGNSVIEFFRRNTDQGLIGHLLGASELGVYTVACKLAMLPGMQITPLVTKVLLPAYSKLQDDHSRLRAAYLRALQYVAFVTTPLAFGLVVVAPELVEVLFGQKWLGAVVPLRFLAIAGAFLAVNPVVGYVLVAKGRPGVFAVWNFVRTTFTVGLLLLGIILGGLNGVAAAFALAIIVDTPIALYIFIAPVEGRLINIWRAAFPVVFSSSLMAGLVYVFRVCLLGYGLHKFLILVLSVLIGGVLYVLLLALLRFHPLFESIDFGRKLVRRYTGLKI